jgi:hypothetical protein
MIAKASVIIRCAALALAGGASVWSASASAASDKVRVTGLADVAFGIVNTASDQSISQDVCAYSSSATSGYSVTAIGDGAGGAFTLAGPAPLPYQVRWSDAANQTNGTALTAGTLTSGFISSASQQTCNSGPAASASLTVIIRAAALGSALAGSYTGTLQVTIAPE